MTGSNLVTISAGTAVAGMMGFYREDALDLALGHGWPAHGVIAYNRCRDEYAAVAASHDERTGAQQ